MKLTLIYPLIALCCAQPAMAQFESDQEFFRQATKQIHSANRVQPSAKKISTQVQQTAKRPHTGGYIAPVRHNGSAGYGYRPQRGSIKSGYGWRPQRAQLMPQGYSQEMLQQKIQRLQAMQQMMGGGAPAQQQQGKGNMLQMLMGGGAPQQQPQQPAQPQLNKGELLKSLFGGGGGATSQSAGE